jgi:hypothetical protein
MNETEFRSAEYHASYEVALAVEQKDAGRAIYWMRRWNELREAFPEYATNVTEVEFL